MSEKRKTISLVLVIVLSLAVFVQNIQAIRVVRADDFDSEYDEGGDGSGGGESGGGESGGGGYEEYTDEQELKRREQEEEQERQRQEALEKAAEENRKAQEEMERMKQPERRRSLQKKRPGKRLRQPKPVRLQILRYTGFP